MEYNSDEFISKMAEKLADSTTKTKNLNIGPSEPPSPIHVSNAGPNSTEMFNTDGKTFKSKILQRQNWVTIHFPNGVASRAVMTDTDNFYQFLRTLNRLQPYHDKFHQMTLWHMDLVQNGRVSDKPNGEYETNVSKGTISFSEPAIKYLGQHLNFVPMDSQIKQDMKYNKAKHNWKSAGFLDKGRFQKACRGCHQFTGISQVEKCKSCKLWVHKDCKEKISSDCESNTGSVKNNISSDFLSQEIVDSAEEDSGLDQDGARWLSIRDSPSQPSKHLAPSSSAIGLGSVSGFGRQLSNPTSRSYKPSMSHKPSIPPPIMPQWSTNTVFDNGPLTGGSVFTNGTNLISDLPPGRFFPDTEANFYDTSSYHDAATANDALHFPLSYLTDEEDKSPKIMTVGNKTNADWRIDFKKITFEKEIGQGAYGTVWECQWFGKVAVKLLSVKNPTDSQQKDFYNEIKVLRGARHPNILNFMGFCHRDPSVSEDSDELEGLNTSARSISDISSIGKSLAIVTEFCEGQTLYHHIHINEDSSLFDDMEGILLIAKQIADGMNYLTNNSKITHRDLKTPNVFLTDGKPPQAKIGDFGLAKVKSGWGNNQHQQKIQMGGAVRGGVAGSILWMAPEICSIRTQQLENEDNDVYSQKSDVYAYGVMLYEMFARRLPFRNIDNAMIILFQVGKNFASIQRQLDDLESNEFNKGIGAPTWMRDLIESCTQFERNDRPDFDKIVLVLQPYVEELKNMKAKKPRLPRSTSEHDIFADISIPISQLDLNL